MGNHLEQIEKRLEKVETSLLRLGISSARIEEQLKELHRAVAPLAELRVDVEVYRTRVNALEKREQDSKRLRWRSITAITTALITGLAALVAAWVNS